MADTNPFEVAHKHVPEIDPGFVSAKLW
eukprot:SAG22_NODE_2918_length_2106_cov_2.264076_1_plen_27_part_10